MQNGNSLQYLSALTSTIVKMRNTLTSEIIETVIEQPHTRYGPFVTNSYVYHCMFTACAVLLLPVAVVKYVCD